MDAAEPAERSRGHEYGIADAGAELVDGSGRGVSGGSWELLDEPGRAFLCGRLSLPRRQAI